MGDNMKRYAMDKLVYWKNKRNRKPLILKGARQVGKTWLMKEFGKKCFKNTAYINFDSDVRMRRIFEEDYDIQRIIRMINIETGERIIPEETLIIFDEVQEAPRAISSLKYFCENAPEYAVVSAGSLLVWPFMRECRFQLEKLSLLICILCRFVNF